MIMITIELWPHGQEERKRVIGTVKIVNDGSGTNQVGVYDYTVLGHDSYDDSWREVASGRIKRHQRAGGVWALIKKVFMQYPWLDVQMGKKLIELYKNEKKDEG